MLEKLTIKDDDKKHSGAFYASDYGKAAINLYFAFTNEPKTNPNTWQDHLKFGAGNGVEAKMGQILKDSGIVAPEYDQKIHGRVDMDIGGVSVHGYIDFITKFGNPIEAKSINNANKYDVLKYQRNIPKESYVGQLATYMRFLNVERGALFVASIDGLNTFWIECRKIGDGVYKCGNVTVDILAEYRRWISIYHNNIQPRKLDSAIINEALYKYDVSTLDWTAQSATAIRKARNNEAVIGDWRVKYSPWKDKILELQGVTPGYTNEELAIIKEKTKGYSTWNRKVITEE